MMTMRESLNVRRVLLGVVFTLAGVVSLLIPGLPFICIGALIFGPIELIIGLAGRDRARGMTVAQPTMPPVGWAPSPPPPAGEATRTTKFCPYCGAKSGDIRAYCANCGRPLP